MVGCRMGMKVRVKELKKKKDRYSEWKEERILVPN